MHIPTHTHPCNEPDGTTTTTPPHPYIPTENVFEELDSDLEYFYDPVTSELYFVPNQTETGNSVRRHADPSFLPVSPAPLSEPAPAPALAPASDTSASAPPAASDTFVATRLEVLFNLTGSSPGMPVSNVTIRGVRLRDTAQSYFAPHGQCASSCQSGTCQPACAHALFYGTTLPFTGQSHPWSCTHNVVFQCTLACWWG